VPVIDSHAEALAHMQARFVTRIIDAICFEALVREDTTVRVELLDLQEGRWLALAADVAAEPEIDAGACLRYNSSLLIGSLALDSDRLWMRMVLPFGTTAPIFDEAVAYVVERAKALRRTVRAPDDDSWFRQHGD